MRRYGDWQAQHLPCSFGDYVAVGETVDDAMVDYFRDVVPPAWFTSSMLQVGEAYAHVDGKPTFTTFTKLSEGAWRYCGTCYIGQTEHKETLR
jgi:hypothetical protein